MLPCSAWQAVRQTGWATCIWCYYRPLQQSPGCTLMAQLCLYAAAAAMPTSSPAVVDRYTVAWLRSASWARVLLRAPPLTGSSGSG